MKHILPSLVILTILSCNRSMDKKGESVDQGKTQESIPERYDPEKRLNELGIQLQQPSAPVANYVDAVRVGNLVFLAGKGPRKENGEYITGKLGAELTVEQGYEAAWTTGINQLAVLKAELGNLNKVKRIVKVKGMVNASPDFKDHPKVVNGHSDLMVKVFGERGKHARAAVGMGSLPINIAVEIEMIVEVFSD